MKLNLEWSDISSGGWWFIWGRCAETDGCVWRRWMLFANLLHFSPRQLIPSSTELYFRLSGATASLADQVICDINLFLQLGLQLRHCESDNFNSHAITCSIFSQKSEIWKRDSPVPELLQSPEAWSSQTKAFLCVRSKDGDQVIPRRRSSSSQAWKRGGGGINRSLGGSHGTAGGRDGCLEVTSEQSWNGEGEESRGKIDGRDG